MPADDVATLASRLLRETECERPKCPCHTSARRGRGLTHCLVHEDHKPSLNINTRGDRLLVYCHSCADNAQVIEALKAAGYWPEKAEYGKAIVAEYDYRDADGKLLYQVLRYAPKDFRQRRPVGKDKWDWKLGDIEPVPYRLPELLASGEQGRAVFIVEGEKDVDRLYAEGVVATCNSGGAGKWTAVHSRYLAGRRCYEIADNEPAGRQHMRGVGRSLEGHGAALVRWVELPGNDEPHADVSDWLDAGHTIDELKALAVQSLGVPDEPQRVFRREGMGWRYETPEVPVSMYFSRLKDRSEETTAELLIEHESEGRRRRLVRRRVNLLAAGSLTYKQIAKTLEEARLGLKETEWLPVLAEASDTMLDAHRDGLVLEYASPQPVIVPPPRWLCEGLVLEGTLNCWLGAGGTGKSTVAKALCVYYGTGYQFLGRPTTQGKALYLDYEDDRLEFDRVVQDTCRNLGVTDIPVLGWLRMKGKRLRDAVQTLARLITENGFTLLVIDAVAAAIGGSGDHARNYDEMASELEEALGQLPPITVLALDHVNAQDHRDQKSFVPQKARGGERKYEVWRNQLSLVIDEEEREFGRHVIVFHQTKLNRGLRAKPFVVEVVYRPNELGVNAVGLSTSQEAISRMGQTSRLLYEVEQQPGLSAKEYAVLAGHKQDDVSVNKTLTQLRNHERRGRVYKDSRERWWPAGADATEPEEAEPAQLPYWSN